MITELRDGDWRARKIAEDAAAAAASGAAASVAADAHPADKPDAGDKPEQAPEAEEAVGGDSRLEGTAAYLAPEIVAGGRPSIASDAWAFGCTLYQARLCPGTQHSHYTRTASRPRCIETGPRCKSLIASDAHLPLLLHRPYVASPLSGRRARPT